MKLVLPKSEEFLIVVISLLVAWLLAAHHNAQYEQFGVPGTYLYWTVRTLIEAATFIAFLFAIEQCLHRHIATWIGYMLAVLLSLIPFALAITALDLIIGLPELGFNGDTETTVGKGKAFGLELLYLLDNHIFLSVLLLIPRLLLTTQNHMQASENTDENATGDATRDMTNTDTIPPAFAETLEPLLDGHLCSMEAQEHYILITTTAESRMVLHRFSDAVRQTPAVLGMQVHRSHWVAHSAVQAVLIEGQSMKLRLTDGRMIPVSRTFRAAVESRYANANSS